MALIDLTTIEVSGRCFSEATRLELFPGNTRYTSVFGRNGSGKTTLSEAMHRFAGEEDEPEVAVRFLDGDGNPCADLERIKAHTYVFNENFTERHIRNRNNGLEEIVLLDESGGLDDEIVAARQAAATIQKAIEDFSERERGYAASRGHKSVSAARSKIKDALKAEDGWASREKAIKGVVRVNVVDTVISSVCSLQPPEESQAALYQDFNEKLGEYQQLSDENSRALPSVPTAALLGAFNDFDGLRVLLEKRIERPELTERDRLILSVVESEGFGAPFVSDAVRILGSGRFGYCPYCFREISEAEVSDLAERVAFVLDDRVRRHQEELYAIKIDDVAFATEPYARQFPAEVLAISESLCTYNNELDALRQALQRKINNVYEPVAIDVDASKEALQAFEIALRALSNAVGAFNEDLLLKNEKQKVLLDLNKRLARHEVDAALTALQVLEAEQEELASNKAKKEAELSEAEQALRSLEARKKSVMVACDIINKHLASIYMDREYLALQEDNGFYVLYSHGQRVSPNDLSTGERNAVALCYFFSQIGSGRSESERFRESCFVVLDDPISSFDYENKIGIHTFLRRQLGRVLLDNDDSKVLILTHDAQSMVSFATTYMRTSSADPWKGLKCRSKILEGFQLRDWDKGWYSYTDQLKDVFNFACNPIQEKLPYMGNTIRRVLEGFCTFEFKSGISVLCEGAAALGRVEDESLRECFAGYMGRMVFNDESHVENAVHAEASIVTYGHYSVAELVRAAKISICMLYCIDRGHVLSHLAQDDAEDTIEGWLDELRATYRC